MSGPDRAIDRCAVRSVRACKFDALARCAVKLQDRELQS